jgi:hypothetical protein
MISTVLQEFYCSATIDYMQSSSSLTVVTVDYLESACRLPAVCSSANVVAVDYL